VAQQFPFWFWGFLAGHMLIIISSKQGWIAQRFNNKAECDLQSLIDSRGIHVGLYTDQETTEAFNLLKELAKAGAPAPLRRFWMPAAYLPNVEIFQAPIQSGDGYTCSLRHHHAYASHRCCYGCTE
jgi:hypothetical protein